MRRQCRRAIGRLKAVEGVFGLCFPFTIQLELSRDAVELGRDFLLGGDHHGQHPRQNSAATTPPPVKIRFPRRVLRSRNFEESCPAAETPIRALLPLWQCPPSTESTFKRRDMVSGQHGCHNTGREA